MNKYKNILINILYFIGTLFIYTLLITLLSFFGILGENVINILNFIFLSVLMFISGFNLAKKTTSKGYISGIIMGFINMGILLMISIILRSEITSSILLYFLILLLSSTIGGMAGINFKLNESKK